MVSDFGNILLFIVGAIIFIRLGLWVTRLFRANNPNIEKLSTYECGEETLGSAWRQFNVRFYVIALVFVLFEIEMVFLFPWAVTFGNELFFVQTKGWGLWIGVLEGILFIGILGFGLIYPWKKGHLTWIKPTISPKVPCAKVPSYLYEQINKKYERHSVS
ncbi:MAG: NADH-quinone oxidoreductase subunit A [Cytophagales bacterium]|nr:NADH-quinone oxidoreductase subunit A [Cytophagales bacterium]MDW8383694.1 NADH-quinone oxidoreductase subunit A [Flammeovirgaceae bacterium]